MNEFLWAQTLHNTLSIMNVYNSVNVVVHSVHQNIISFELRDTAVLNGNSIGEVVVFGRIKLQSEYVNVEVTNGLRPAMIRLIYNKNKVVETYIKRKQTK